MPTHSGVRVRAGCWCEVFREPGSGPTSSVLHWGFCSRNLQAPEMELFTPGRARRVTRGRGGQGEWFPSEVRSEGFGKFKGRLKCHQQTPCRSWSVELGIPGLKKWDRND